MKLYYVNNNFDQDDGYESFGPFPSREEAKYFLDAMYPNDQYSEGQDSDSDSDSYSYSDSDDRLFRISESETINAREAIDRVQQRMLANEWELMERRQLKRMNERYWEALINSGEVTQSVVEALKKAESNNKDEYAIRNPIALFISTSKYRAQSPSRLFTIASHDARFSELDRVEKIDTFSIGDEIAKRVVSNVMSKARPPWDPGYYY